MLLSILDVFFTLISNLPAVNLYLVGKISYARKSKMAAVTNLANDITPLVSLISPYIQHLSINIRCIVHAEFKSTTGKAFSGRIM